MKNFVKGATYNITKKMKQTLFLLFFALSANAQQSNLNHDHAKRKDTSYTRINPNIIARRIHRDTILYVDHWIYLEWKLTKKRDSINAALYGLEAKRKAAKTESIRDAYFEQILGATRDVYYIDGKVQMLHEFISEESDDD